MGTWDWNVVGDRHSWSAETEALFGLPLGSFDGTLTAFQAAIHPEDWPLLHQEWQNALVEQRDVTAIYRTVWPDGSLHWIEDRGRAIRTTDGTLSSCL